MEDKYSYTFLGFKTKRLKSDMYQVNLKNFIFAQSLTYLRHPFRTGPVFWNLGDSHTPCLFFKKRQGALIHPLRCMYFFNEYSHPM